jgi:uncharacterized membrane-anchored protein
MRTATALALLAGSAFFAPVAAQEPTGAHEAIAEFEATLSYQQGIITLGNGLAILNVPESFRFLGPDDAQRVLVDAWGNPPGEKPLGMLTPANVSPLADDGWAVVITYEEDGYVADDDAASIDYDALLREMQEDARASNAEREKLGYAPVELIGWAAPPHYDAATHKLYWAKELRFGDEPVHTLNYNIRVLGRRGVLVLNAVGTMDQFATIEEEMKSVLDFVEFNPGHRYADFVPGVDRIAAYGIAGLIAGKAAAKAGFFKLLLAGILAAKKLIIAGAIAVVALVRSIFGRRRAKEPGTAA